MTVAMMGIGHSVWGEEKPLEGPGKLQIRNGCAEVQEKFSCRGLKLGCGDIGGG